MLYDLTIIGGGPAGGAASIYAARKRLNTLFITFEFGGQSVVSEKIHNWIGTTEIAGAKLASDIKDHVMANAGETLNIKTDSGEEFESKTVLIASGSSRRKLDVKNADKLEHKGLTYCATCDGPIFSGADVAVIGGGNAAFESASQLLAYCNSVTLVSRSRNFRADEITVEKVSKNPKLKIITNSDIIEIKGENFVD